MICGRGDASDVGVLEDEREGKLVGEGVDL